MSIHTNILITYSVPPLKALKSEADIREGLTKVKDDSEDGLDLSERLTKVTMTKENLFRTFSVLEEDIRVKERQVKKKKK